MYWKKLEESDFKNKEDIVDSLSYSSVEMMKLYEKIFDKVGIETNEIKKKKTSIKKEVFEFLWKNRKNNNIQNSFNNQTSDSYDIESNMFNFAERNELIFEKLSPYYLIKTEEKNYLIDKNSELKYEFNEKGKEKEYAYALYKEHLDLINKKEMYYQTDLIKTTHMIEQYRFKSEKENFIFNNFTIYILYNNYGGFVNGDITYSLKNNEEDEEEVYFYDNNYDSDDIMTELRQKLLNTDDYDDFNDRYIDSKNNLINKKELRKNNFIEAELLDGTILDLLKIGKDLEYKKVNYSIIKISKENMKKFLDKPITVDNITEIIENRIKEDRNEETFFIKINSDNKDNYFSDNRIMHSQYNRRSVYRPAPNGIFSNNSYQSYGNPYFNIDDLNSNNQQYYMGERIVKTFQKNNADKNCVTMMVHGMKLYEDFEQIIAYAEDTLEEAYSNDKGMVAKSKQLFKLKEDNDYGYFVLLSSSYLSNDYISLINSFIKKDNLSNYKKSFNKNNLSNNYLLPDIKETPQ